MHLLLRETHGLGEGEAAAEPGGAPADILFLSFSDSDLSAAAAATLPPGFPTVRLEQIGRFLHPLSVDLLCERLVAKARIVIVRLLGGLDYWRYGMEEVAAACAASGALLAVLPGDGTEDDPKLAAVSTVPPVARAAIAACLRQGGADNLARALMGAAHTAGLWPDAPSVAIALPAFGLFELKQPQPRSEVVAAIIFYRSHLLAGETATVEALSVALAARGLAARVAFVDSLKNPGAGVFVRDWLIAWKPVVVLNLTGFAARLGDAPSPLEAAGVPVLQLVQAGTSRAAWQASSRGLSQADLAMQVVLPETDGRLLTTAVSFKERDEAGRARLVPDPEGIALAADRAAGWARLATTPPAERRVAIILSDYPGAERHEVGHAVGLDSLASVAVILQSLRRAGYRTSTGDVGELTHGETVIAGNVVIAVQPDRDNGPDRRAGYHDPAMPPAENYIAFYRRLTQEMDVHAMIHLGTHGTLEWLPGKAAALSAQCWPVVLTRGLPVIYPFIVNNPGEAAAAKRRLGAVTIGHNTPPLQRAGLSGRAAALERLIDEFAAADGLDRRRASALRREILAEATTSGLLAESGARPEVEGEDAALARLDAYLCDVKDMQIRDGLHVFARPPAPAQRAALLAAGLDPAGLDACAEAEGRALLAALDGRFVPPGPAGAPTRGRPDVLPTGRNLITFDPRAIPTPSAMALAQRAAAALLARHRQDHGEWPRALVIDLWGSATMRTGGEDFGLALVLLGVRPLWDVGSSRVGGFEVLPLAVLDRPRVDVSLRVSGLFRDAFPQQIALFDQAARAVAARVEDVGWNPLVGIDGARVFGPAAGAYGSSVVLDGSREVAARSYLAGSATAWEAEAGRPDAATLAARIGAADAFVHTQDHAETDILESPDYAAHEGGFAAASSMLGRAPALYHLDASDPEAPKARLVAEEVRRVVRARAANPRWIAGMMRHGYRGAAEIVRGVESLAGFATTLPDRFDAQFDQLYDATLGDASVTAFLEDANPAALSVLQARFRDALARDLWRPRRNDVAVAAE
jgi:cobaltochelatase CobN